MQLRPYQEKCVGQVFESWIDYRKVLAVLPTGGGKTIVFANIARRADGRTLILAHREELLTQAIDKIKLATGIDASLERAESRSNPSSKIVVGSIQSMMRRLDKFQPTDFSNVIVDEAHHVAADSYMSVLGHFPEANILGVTATPDRSDKKQLGNYFEHVACEISLMDLIKDGYLSPIKVRVCDVSIDLSRVSFSVGDFDANDTADALEPYLERVAQQIKEYGGKKTLIFLPLISTSEMMARICKSLGLNARHVDGASEDRSSIIKWFKEQDRAVLCNAMLLTEGYDEPSIDTIVCLRPTRSRALYTQMIGRGTRLHPGKTHLTILDFLWMTGRHKLVRPTRLVTQDEVGDIADQMISNQGEFDLQDVARNAVEERERSLARELAKKKKNRGQLIDPIEFAISIHDTDIADFEPTMPWHSDPVTPAQREILKDFDMSDITCKGQASAIINRMFQRRDMGLASVKQVQLMRRLGVKNPEKIRFKDAGEIIGRMIPKR
jgi:superfamily II DNA or RNA helicase